QGCRRRGGRVSRAGGRGAGAVRPHRPPRGGSGPGRGRSDPLRPPLLDGRRVIPRCTELFPSPLAGEGQGGGAEVLTTSQAILTPPPRPSPARGEGEKQPSTAIWYETISSC